MKLILSWNKILIELWEFFFVVIIKKSLMLLIHVYMRACQLVVYCHTILRRLYWHAILAERKSFRTKVGTIGNTRTRTPERLPRFACCSGARRGQMRQPARMTLNCTREEKGRRSCCPDKARPTCGMWARTALHRGQRTRRRMDVYATRELSRHPRYALLRRVSTPTREHAWMSREQ